MSLWKELAQDSLEELGNAQRGTDEGEDAAALTSSAYVPTAVLGTGQSELLDPQAGWVVWPSL